MMESDWDKKRKALITRLRRVEGQLRGIQRMMEEDQDCERVAQQLSAARKALDKTFYETMACAMRQELSQAQSSDSQSSAKLESQIKHITDLISKYA
ncbi:metal-sensitive transcriptional regulator [uncultured Microbulbifer sp.]|uniref:metal-sensitive transcriptional regulator n=1 Tax=uncultured Microbulbifer sp. TaxID=348147 RepID=UPI0025CF55FB|nr:metal-sensitive transcriptional regulator [uncultured Microbulbifer sp.]